MGGGGQPAAVGKNEGSRGGGVLNSQALKMSSNKCSNLPMGGDFPGGGGE